MKEFDPLGRQVAQIEMFREVRACLNSINMTCRAHTDPQQREHRALCDLESRIGLRVRCESWNQVIIERLNTAVKLFLHAVLEAHLRTIPMGSGKARRES